MPSIARPTKGATCSCDDADPTSRGPRRVGRRSPRRQLPPVPSPRRELSRRRTGGRPTASVRTRGRRARRVALGVLVRLRDPGRRALLARGGAVALHAAVGARLSRDDRALRRVACAALLVGRPRASPPAPHAAGDRVSRRLDRRGMGGGPSGRHSLSLARPGQLAHGCRCARAVGRPGGRAGSDPVARLVQRDARRSDGREQGAGRREPYVAVASSRGGARDGPVCLGVWGVARADAPDPRARHRRTHPAERRLPREMGSPARG